MNKIMIGKQHRRFYVRIRGFDGAVKNGNESEVKSFVIHDHTRKLTAEKIIKGLKKGLNLK